MKKKTTIVTEEFAEDGGLASRITETTEEEDEGYIYPQQPYPWCPSTGNPVPNCTEITCNCNKD